VKSALLRAYLLGSQGLLDVLPDEKINVMFTFPWEFSYSRTLFTFS